MAAGIGAGRNGSGLACVEAYMVMMQGLRRDRRCSWRQLRRLPWRRKGEREQQGVRACDARRRIGSDGGVCIFMHKDGKYVNY